MKKKELLEALRVQLEKNKAALIEAAKATYEAATHEESKPENEYDTRGLEASYLAGAQAKRISEIEEILVICKHLSIKDFSPDDKINASAVVEVKHKEKSTFFFFLPKGGGVHFSFQGKEFQVITPSSPLGEALQDLLMGDVALVDQGNKTLEYEILNVW